MRRLAVHVAVKNWVKIKSVPDFGGRVDRGLLA